MTRDEARMQGLKLFEPDTPCKLGHNARRRVDSGQCVECRRLYMQEYRRQNPGKAAADSRNWRKHNPEYTAEQNRRYYKDNSDRLRDKAKAWRTTNPEQVKRQSAERYRRDPEAEKRRVDVYRKRNPEKVRENLKRQYRKNPAPYKIRAVERKLLKERASIPLSLEDQAWMKRIYTEVPEGHHVDHIWPLRGINFSGLHVPWNLQYLPAAENIRKSNKPPC